MFSFNIVSGVKQTCGRREVVAGFSNNAEWCKCSTCGSDFFHRVNR